MFLACFRCKINENVTVKANINVFFEFLDPSVFLGKNGLKGGFILRGTFSKKINSFLSKDRCKFVSYTGFFLENSLLSIFGIFE